MDKNLERLSNMNKEVDMVNHPPHYCRENGMECIDEMELIFGKEETMTFCKLNAWKYRYRAADKNGQQDLEKSDWYIKKYKELKEKYNFTEFTEPIITTSNPILTQPTQPFPPQPPQVPWYETPWYKTTSGDIYYTTRTVDKHD